MLKAGFHDVAPGMLATTVTHLELTALPDGLEAPVWPDGISVEHVTGMGRERYRALFERVGAEYLWASRLRMSDHDLVEILADPGVEIWVLRAGEADLGICEIDLRFAPEMGELAFFGLDGALQGQGLARPLMAHALIRAFAAPLKRLTVHTCTLDHHAALPFYMRAGFVPTRQEVEIMQDPRLEGLLPESAAPQIPLIRPAG
ncbi:MAG: GNAT family N-acetyltransferase [Mangrovicoccus sp.]|nr:GNAT family N-acetyltransferase [Mangrovicoccus sp.]